MPQIPYTGVPDVQPSNIPMESGATPQAFGVNIGDAISRLGETGNKVGNELFSRAIALQHVQNENAANTAALDTLVANGKANDEFLLKQGDVPQQTVDEHVQKLRDTVMQGGQSLTPDGRVMYNQMTQRRLGYDIETAYKHSATQLKTYSVGVTMATGDAQIDNMVRDARTNPERLDQDFNDFRKSVNDEASLLDLHRDSEGNLTPQLQRKLQDRYTKAVDAVAVSMVNGGNPKSAINFLNAHKDDIGELNHMTTMDKVKARSAEVLAARDARLITGNGDNTMIGRARTVIGSMEGGAKGYVNVTTTTNSKGQPQSALGRYGIMDFNLPQWSNEVLGRVVTQEEFLSHPEIQDQIFDAKMGQYLQKYGIEGAGRAWLGGSGGVTNPNATDPLGTSTGRYGSQFSARMSAGGQFSTGPKSPPDVDSYYKAAQQSAELNAQEMGWSDTNKEAYLEHVASHIRSMAGMQAAGYAQSVKQANAAIQKVWSDPNMVSFDANGKATIGPHFYDAITEANRQFGGVASNEARVMVDWAQHQQLPRKQPVATDPAVQQHLYDGMFDPQKPTTRIDILRESALNHLDDHATKTLLALNNELEKEPLKGQIWTNTMNVVKGQLIYSDPLQIGKDLVGMSNYSNFLQTFIPEYINERRTGKLKPNALDANDPKSLISEAMAPFNKRSYSDKIRDYRAAGVLGSSPSDKPNTDGKIIDIPKDMTPEEVMKQYKSGTPIRLPDGRLGKVP